MYLHPKNRSISSQKRQKMFCFRHFQVFTRCSFQNVPVSVPFSKSTVFEICRQKMCRFPVNRRPIRRIFHRFQNVPPSCENAVLVKSNFSVSLAQGRYVGISRIGLLWVFWVNHLPSYFFEFLKFCITFVSLKHGER